MPAWIKLLIVPAVSIAAFNMPPLFLPAAVLAQAVLAFFLRFSLSEQLRDLKFALCFAPFLYITGFAGIFCASLLGGGMDFASALASSAGKSLGNSETAVMLLRLICLLQSSSLVFKTTTSLEIRNGIGDIEGAARRLLGLRPGLPLTELLAFTLYFIPLVFKIWSQLEAAWKARQGKASPRMFMALLPALFSVGMKSAYNAARAVMARSV